MDFDAAYNMLKTAKYVLRPADVEVLLDELAIESGDDLAPLAENNQEKLLELSFLLKDARKKAFKKFVRL